MGYSSSAIVFYLGDYGVKDKNVKAIRCPFIGGQDPDISAVNVLANVFNSYTTASRTAYEAIIKWTTPSGRPSNDSNLDVKARIAFKDSADGKIYRIEIPAPVATMFEKDSEGDRVKTVPLNTIVAALSTAYNRTFIPLWGKKIQRS